MRSFRICVDLVGLLVGGIALVGCGRSNRDQVHVDPEILNAYAGQYQPAPDTVVTVKREDEHLGLQVNHQRGMSFSAETQDTFLHPESSTRIRFARDSRGKVTHLVLIREGRTNAATRIAQPSDEGQVIQVVIGGQELCFVKMGDGSPTVVLWGGSDSWRPVQLEVAKLTRVVSLNGMDPSTPRATTVPRRPSDAVAELRKGLEQAGIRPPYILVGHSFGGAFVRVFANLYPNDVSGIVLVDPFQEGFVDWLKSHQPANHDKFAYELGRNYVSDWEGSMAELRGASAFPNLPVVLLSATQRRSQNGNAFEQGISSKDFAEGSEAIVKAHQEWLAKLPRGRHVEVEGTSHDIPKERPEAVSRAIQTLVEQNRKPEK